MCVAKIARYVSATTSARLCGPVGEWALCKKEDRGGKSHSDLYQGNGKSLSDRSQVIGGKLLIGQLAPWVTWGI